MDGWALQNMQTQKLIMNSTAAVASSTAFGDMLSDVVNDSTLTKNNTTQKPADTTTTIAPARCGHCCYCCCKLQLIRLTDSLQQPEKISEQNLDTGTNMMFVDKTQNGVDTINVFVPSESSASNTYCCRSATFTRKSNKYASHNSSLP